ncbi:hypothetical protein LRP52_48475, partial [Photobacterium sp. ZSDE20]|nr:hypothetical protein [Photobacterium sp. ZSDE20]
MRYIIGMQFGRLPNWWYRNSHLLKNLKASESGLGIATMKCLIALSVLIEFHSRTTDSSLSDLEKITGLSRPMVIKGLDNLESLGIISVDRGGYKNKYELLN